MATGKASKMLLASAVVGLVSVGTLAAGPHQANAAEKVRCYGVNKCKGTGGCGGAGHACAGHNACKGQGFIQVDSKEACLKMEGGRLTAEKK